MLLLQRVCTKILVSASQLNKQEEVRLCYVCPAESVISLDFIRV